MASKQASVSRKIILGRIRKYYPKVKTVSDETKPIVIHVTEKDCSGAVGSNFSQCALARAAKRGLKADGAIIGLTYSYIIHGTRAFKYKTPQSVAREILSFDRHSDFDAGAYHLGPIPPSRLMGADKRRKPGPKKGKDNPQLPHYVHISARVRRRP